MNRIDISQFDEVPGVLDGTPWYLVIKSQDQLARRRRLAASRRRGRFGRIEPRPVAEGLLVCGRLRRGTFEVRWSRTFREPRHLRWIDSRQLLLTEMNRLLRIDRQGEVLREYRHRFFAFLHTVDLQIQSGLALIASPGYDSVIELDLESGRPTLHWLAWDHGFNPDEDGVWLAADRAVHERYRAEGKMTRLIDPSEHGDQGLVTSHRSAHPNAAVYDPYDHHRSFIISIGHSGRLYRAQRDTGHTQLVCDDLRQMPHGLRPCDPGWIITDTTRGEWRKMNARFESEIVYSTAQLGGKAPGTGDLDWLQQVVMFDDRRALGLDANRGLLAMDLQAGCYSICQVDPNWCVQDAVVADGDQPGAA